MSIHQSSDDTRETDSSDRRAPRAVLAAGAFSLVFAGLAVAFARGPSVHLPLYASAGCPGDYCFPDDPGIAMVPLLAAFLLQWTPSAGALNWRRRFARGLALGLLSIAYVGLLSAASLPFHNAYFATVYKLYATAYVTVATALVTFWLARRASSAESQGDGITMPLAATVILAAIATLGQHEWAVAFGAAAGVLIGVGVWRSRLWRRATRPTERQLLVAVTLIAIVLRMGFGLQELVHTGPGMAFAVASDDGDSYYLRASHLAADARTYIDVLVGGAFPPMYSFFLAAIFALTHESMAVVIIAQALLAGAATVLLYLFARHVVDRGPALVAAALFAVDQNLIQNEATLTPESILIPTVLFCLWSFARYARTRATGWLLSASVALGVAFITRNVVGLALLAGALVWLLIYERRDLRRSARDVAVCVVALVIASLPVAVASYAREGSPRLTTQWASVQWDYEGAPGYTISNRFFLDRGIRPFTDPAGSLRSALADPLAIARFYTQAIPRRVSTLLFFGNNGESDPVYIINPTHQPTPFGDSLLLLRAMALGIACIAIVRSRRWDDPVVLLGITYVAAYFAVFTLVFPPYHAFRYRIPIEPLRFVAEAAGALWLLRMVYAMSASSAMAGHAVAVLDRPVERPAVAGLATHDPL